MLLKTFDGEVIKLYGSQIGSGSETAGIVSGNIVLPVTEISSTAQFKISPQQFDEISFCIQFHQCDESLRSSINQEEMVRISTLLSHRYI